MGEPTAEEKAKAEAEAIKAEQAAAQAREEALAKKKAEAEEAALFWLNDPNYTGPLTADQAQRRLEKHGHWKQPETKPADVPQTKGGK